MADVPRYPDGRDVGEPEPETPGGPGSRRAAYVWWAVAVAVVVVVVVLHLVGVLGPGGH